jgi:hypothetical protein
MGLDSRLELLCHPYQRCGSPSILVEHDFMEPGRRIELRYAGYESAALPIELTRRLTGASSQSLTGFPGIQILRIDGNAYEAALNAGVLPLDDTPEGARDSNPDFRLLGAGDETRTHEFDLGMVTLCH